MKVVQTIDATPTSQLTLSYTLPVDGRQGKDKYLCTSSSGEFVSLTISFDDHPTSEIHESMYALCGGVAMNSNQL